MLARPTFFEPEKREQEMSTKLDISHVQGETTAQTNKAIVEAFIQSGIIDRNFGEAQKYFSQNYKFNGRPTSWQSNVDWVNGLHERNPGFEFTIEAILAEENRVALRWKLVGKAHEAREEGYICGTNIMTLEDGKIVDNMQNGLFAPSWEQIAVGHYTRVHRGP